MKSVTEEEDRRQKTDGLTFLQLERHSPLKIDFKHIFLDLEVQIVFTVLYKDFMRLIWTL